MSEGHCYVLRFDGKRPKISVRHWTQFFECGSGLYFRLQTLFIAAKTGFRLNFFCKFQNLVKPQTMYKGLTGIRSFFLGTQSLGHDQNTPNFHWGLVRTRIRAFFRNTIPRSFLEKMLTQVEIFIFVKMFVAQVVEKWIWLAAICATNYVLRTYLCCFSCFVRWYQYYYYNQIIYYTQLIWTGFTSASSGRVD